MCAKEKSEKKTVSYETVLKSLGDNYVEIERSIVNQLLLEVPNHHLTTGTYREKVWQELFEMVIPKKYRMEQSVFIIDSFGNISKEVDLAIFDELYTPYIFNYGKIKFIPIEAVAAVVQCKSRNPDEEGLDKWVESINGLITSFDSVARQATAMTDNLSELLKEIEPRKKVTQTATRPIEILCMLEGEDAMEKYEEYFDIILSSKYSDKREDNKLCKLIPNSCRSLKEWNTALNHSFMNGSMGKGDIDYRQKKIAEIENDRPHILEDLKVLKGNPKEENVILSLVFQLNQLLMIINNPMLFPHRAYANRFSKILQGKEQTKDKQSKEKK
ncbi:hypothetical protein INP51_02755 [Blautia liquoris]|uniref:DUF6602 domain-containing protein n=1 Tax=Blautia liquoris TaxID=2779518 RepID=A0A7M2RHV3_9FIRM|nr:DUF6602 domain-containing protein [Blautia liquoris]QOV19905.1 hypothetical protein INP51_02755 [Blautia liquoris]